MVPVASKQRVGQQKSKFKNDDAPLILVFVLSPCTGGGMMGGGMMMGGGGMMQQPMYRGGPQMQQASAPMMQQQPQAGEWLP